MYRNEIGIYYIPYYDKGDYQQEIKVVETEDDILGSSQLFDRCDCSTHSLNFYNALEEEANCQQRRSHRAKEIVEEKSQALLEAEAEMCRRMNHRDKIINHVSHTLIKDDDDFQLCVNGKVVL